jgi:hypothetical protein
MCSVEEASSHKYDWHVSSNTRIGGNQGEKAEGTRAIASSARSEIVLEPTTFHPCSTAILPLSLALHPSPLSYGLQDIKETLLWNMQSYSLKQQGK